MIITYAVLDDAPAVLIRMEDGRVYGYVYENKAWKDGQDLAIVTEGRIMAEDAWKDRFEYVPDPPVPA